MTDRLATISGIVYAGAGRYTGKERGVPGVRVHLDTNYNGRIDPGERTATTDADGRYVFADILPSSRSYRVRPVLEGAVRDVLYPPGNDDSIWFKIDRAYDSSTRHIGVELAPAPSPVVIGAGRPRATLELAIVGKSDSPTKSRPYFDACGIRAIRDFLSMDWRTGRVARSKIDSDNAWHAAGWAVLATATPAEAKNRSGPMGDMTLCLPDLLSLRQGIQVGVGNESTYRDYGIGAGNADYLAFHDLVWLPLATQLHAAGRPAILHSITNQTPDEIVRFATALHKRTPPGLVGGFDAHNYTRDAGNFREVCEATRFAADLFGCPAVMSEWGVPRYTTDAKFAAVLPSMRASIRAHVDVSALYQAGRFSSANGFPYLWDAATGEVTASYAAYAASK